MLNNQETHELYMYNIDFQADIAKAGRAMSLLSGVYTTNEEWNEIRDYFAITISKIHGVSFTATCELIKQAVGIALKNGD